MLYSINLLLAKIFSNKPWMSFLLGAMCCFLGAFFVTISLFSYANEINPESLFFEYIVNLNIYQVILCNIIGILLFIMFFKLMKIDVYEKELPEYKARKEKERADKILVKANKILKKFEFTRNDRTKKLRGLIFLCGDGTNIDEINKLENWIDTYKDTVFLKECVAKSEEEIKSIPEKNETRKNRIRELEASL